MLMNHISPKTRDNGLPISEDGHHMFIHFDTILACNERTDIYAVAKTVLSIAVCCKNLQVT